MLLKNVFSKTICLLLLSFLAVTWGPCTLCAEEQVPPPITVRAVLLPYLDYCPFFIAEEEGYFAEQGIDIEFIKMYQSAKAVPGLIQGDIDVLGGSISAAKLNSIARGANIKFVAGKGYIDPNGCPVSPIVARRALLESGELDSPDALRGRLFHGQKAELTTEFMIERVLNPAGMTLTDVSLKFVPHPTMIDALKNGSVDFIAVGEPWTTRLVNSGYGVIWKTDQELIPNVQLAAIMFGPSFLERNPEAGKRFMVAYLKAIRTYEDGKTARNLEIIAKYTGVEQDLLKQACWPNFHSDGSINIESVMEFQTWALEKGYTDTIVPEEQLWDSSFIEYAGEVLSSE